MAKHVALLRGINVGGKNKVEMKRLNAAFEELGFESVSTYINSGNVVFEAKESDPAKLALKIERKLRSAFGFDVPTVVHGRAAILKVAKAIPAAWRNDGEQRTEVFFLWDEFDGKESLKLLKPRAGVDSVMYVPGAIAWNFLRKDATKSGIRYVIGTDLYRGMTGRNVNTVRKLAELMA